jgi:hypothetical protein
MLPGTPPDAFAPHPGENMSRAGEMNDQPLQRRDDLVTTETGDDLLVYDPESHALHTLNSITANVFRQSDGSATIADLVRETGLTEDQVRLALELLRQAGLLRGEVLPGVTASTSRRRFLRKAGVAVGAPALVSVTAPMASAAASVICTPSGEPCNMGDPAACCSRTCTNFNPPSPPVCG